jgi:hypothetical protein
MFGKRYEFGVVLAAASLCACATSRPAPKEVLDIQTFEPWEKYDVEVDVPESFSGSIQDSETWKVIVKDGVEYELWPGGVRAKGSFWWSEFYAVEWEPEPGRVRLRGSDGPFIFFPTVAHDALVQSINNQSSLLYDDAGFPFARLRYGTRLKTVPGEVTDPRFVHVCVGDTECWARGYIRKHHVGPFMRVNAVTPSFWRETAKDAVAQFKVEEENPITLYNEAREPLVRNVHGVVAVFDTDGARKSVIVAGSGRVLRGWVETAALEEVAHEIPKGPFIIGTGSGEQPLPDAPVGYLHKGSWFYGAPDMSTRFALVRYRSVPFTIRPSDEDGWSETEIETPWGTQKVFIRDMDVKKRRP